MADQKALSKRSLDPVRKQAKPGSALSELARVSPPSVAETFQRAVVELRQARPAHILALQRAAGNQAVTGLIQARLIVGAAGDQYEQEADRVAERVLTMPVPVSQTPANGVQRQEDEEEIQTKPIVQRQAEEEDIQTAPLQRQGYLPHESTVNSAQVIMRTIEMDLMEERGRGQSLPAGTRLQMEGLFGADLSQVRIHTDQRAAHLSRALNARAFTLQEDIFFNQGHYDPGSTHGKALLAHELTHVLQQTGKPQASLVVSQPGDRDEQEANVVASLVSQAETMRQPTTVPQIHARIARLPGTIQRAVTAGKVAKGLGKAFLKSFVNAIAGPLSYIWTFGDRRKEWRRIGGQMSYGQGRLADAARVLAKAAILMRELAMFAGWTSLLTGVGSLIAAAFAPAGLAASAILGTISTIAGLVAMGAGALQAVINLILGIGNLIRLRGVDDKLDRSKIKVMVIRDFVGALSGLIGAIGGAVGFGAGGGSVMQSASEIGSKTMGELGKEFAIGTGAVGQSFAFAGEAQGAMGELAEQEVKQKIRPLKRVAAHGQKLMPGGLRKAIASHATARRTPPSVPPRLQKQRINLSPMPGGTLKLYRAGDDKLPEPDMTPQLLTELDKIGTVAGMAQGWASEERQLVGEEKAEVGQELSMANRAGPALEGDAAQVSTVSGHLQEIDEKGDAGAEATEAVSEALPDKQVTQERGAKLEEAHQQLDQIEAKSGEPAPKRGLLGRMGDWLKKGWQRFKRWVLSSMASLKARLKGIFAKIKAKVAQLLIKVMGLEEPMGEVGDAAASTITNAPVATETLDEAGEGAGEGVTLAQRVAAAVAQAKNSLK